MAQWSFPFADVGGDRMNSDDDFAQYYAFLYKTGVFMTYGDGLLVRASPTQGMRVIISSGGAGINGRFYFNSIDLALDVPVASTTQDRIDSVVLRLDLAERQIILAYKSNSIAVVRNEVIHEIQLARVAVKRNASGITAADIEDMRSNETFCGYASPFYEVSVSGLEQQYQSLLEQTFENFRTAAEENQDSLEQLLADQEQMVLGWFDQIQTDTANMLANQQMTIQDWFAGLQNQLDSNQAANLQNQINGLTANHEIFNIVHGLKAYPQVMVTCWVDGLGITGIGESTWLGSVPETLPVTIGYPSWNEVTVKVPIGWQMVSPVVTETAPFSYLLVEGRKSLRVRISEGVGN